jgi:hypothetical protein
MLTLCLSTVPIGRMRVSVKSHALLTSAGTEVSDQLLNPATLVSFSSHSNLPFSQEAG